MLLALLKREEKKKFFVKFNEFITTQKFHSESFLQQSRMSLKFRSKGDFQNGGESLLIIYKFLNSSNGFAARLLFFREIIIENYLLTPVASTKGSTTF